MSTLKATTIEPATSTDITLGTTGDIVAVTGNTLVLDTWKDSGGNTLFTSDGSGSVSSVNAGFMSTMGIISSQTAADSSIMNFTSGLTATYKEYQFEFIDVRPSNDDVTFEFQCSIDGGSNYNVQETTTVWEIGVTEASGSDAPAYITSRDQAAGTAYQCLAEGVGNAAGENTSGTLHLFNPSSTAYAKNWMATTQADRHNPGGRVSFTAGYFNTTTAINAISFKMSAGTFSGTIKMYGIE